jgi:hypothetical protein
MRLEFKKKNTRALSWTKGVTKRKQEKQIRSMRLSTQWTLTGSGSFLMRGRSLRKPKHKLAQSSWLSLRGGSRENKTPRMGLERREEKGGRGRIKTPITESKRRRDKREGEKGGRGGTKRQ